MFKAQNHVVAKVLFYQLYRIEIQITNELLLALCQRGNTRPYLVMAD